MKKDAKELAELRAGQQGQEEAGPEPVDPFVLAQTVIEVTPTHISYFIDARLLRRKEATSALLRANLLCTHPRPTAAPAHRME